MRPVLLFILVLLGSCDPQPAEESRPRIFAGNKNTGGTEAIAYFSEGCFWHSEIIFQSLVGVNDAISGYSGGSDPNPSYEAVCSGSTGHAETVEVHYDPAKISFKTLVAAFFASHDPTTLNRQGYDEGTQYRSIAFYRTEEEKRIIEEEVKKLSLEEKFAGNIVTEIKPFSRFYPAEDYHQEYVINNPWNGYVQNVSVPDYEKFRSSFKGNYK